MLRFKPGDSVMRLGKLATTCAMPSGGDSARMDPVGHATCTGVFDVIRKEACSFYVTSFGVRLCWELEEPKGSTIAASARSYAAEPGEGCVATADMPPAKSNVSGAIQRHVSQLMQLLSTNKFPSTWCGL